MSSRHIMDMEKELELIPKDGTYALPYVANCAGILYNKDIFEEHGWEHSGQHWDEFTSLCASKSSPNRYVHPLYFGFKDTWTCYSTVECVGSWICQSRTTCSEVNAGNTTFTRCLSGVLRKKMKAAAGLCRTKSVRIQL